MSGRDGSPAPFAYDGLDRVMHEKARLGVLTSLMSYPKGLAFNDLKQLCGLTDGNLNRHLQVLVDAGLIETAKVFDGSRAVTRCRLTRRRPAALHRLSRGPGEGCPGRSGNRSHNKLSPVRAAPPPRLTEDFFERPLCNAKHWKRPASHRHHHGRKRALGGGPGAAPPARPRGRRQGDTPDARGGAGFRHRDAYALRLLQRQLEKAEARGRRADGAVAPLYRHRVATGSSKTVSG